MKRLLLIALVVTMLCGCSGRATTVRIANDSTYRVWNLRVHGEGFAASVPLLKPGESVTVDVYPASETGIAVDFWTASGDFNIPQGGYVEGGGLYSADVRITEDLKVEVEAHSWPL